MNRAISKALAISIVALFTATVLSGCIGENPSKSAVHSLTNPLLYTSVVGGVESAVFRTFAGESEAPWASGIKAEKFVSNVSTVKDGFVFPGVFSERWQDALTTKQINYWQTTEKGFADLGWIIYNSPSSDAAKVAMEFKQPLTLCNWGSSENRIESTTPAYIMKYNTIALFSPRNEGKGKPELEGDATAKIVCENFAPTPGGNVAFDYTLNITGQGTLRYYDVGIQWQVLTGDKEETCNVQITRKGTMEVSKTDGIVKNIFTETWYAKSTSSDMVIKESSLDGAGKTYSLSAAPAAKNAFGASIGASGQFPGFNVRDFGATGDGAALDTKAINAAVDNCSKAGGGIVYLPAGTYISGSIHMKSNVTMKFDKDATLLGTRDISQYDPYEKRPNTYQDASHSFFHHSFIWGENLTNIAFIGPGTIDGNEAFDATPLGEGPPQEPAWIMRDLLYRSDSIYNRGPKPIALKLCTNILIKDIMIKNAPDEAILMAGCDNVYIDGYVARDVNVDGIDPDCCHNVTITNAEIKSFDDAVAVKATYALGYKRSTENLTFKNSLISNVINAFKIGTESSGDFRNILFDSCVARDPMRANPTAVSGGIVMMSQDGGILDGICYSNLTLINVECPIFVRLGNRMRGPPNATSTAIGSVRNAVISNVEATTWAGIATSSITAVEGYTLDGGVKLSNINITVRGGYPRAMTDAPVPEIRESDGVYPDPQFIVTLPVAYGFFVRHVKGIEFHNISLGFTLPDQRAGMVCEDVENILIDNFNAQQAPGGSPAIVFRQQNEFVDHTLGTVLGYAFSFM
ncbi:MAG: glycosyl hydrolase family 28 protein [Candidatus Thermoplasmatota archaeon]|nr:glycosyl hydrolase family 28 protein [Candidatus Thermoplasmatota archaeon]